MTKQLSDKARQERNAYMRDWRKKHREHVQEYQREYWERKAQQTAEQKHAQEVDNASTSK